MADEQYKWLNRDAAERLLRGEPLDAVSREVQVPAHEVEQWRRDFLESGLAGLKKRSGEGDTKALKQAQAKIGELTMKLELVEMLLEKRQAKGSQVPVASTSGSGSMIPSRYSGGSA
jgi:hypothetical protein